MDSSKNKTHFFKHLKADIPAGIVVFLVAMPLCLGIALASGAPLFSGIIAGMVGGIVVGSLSGSTLGVSGPAAGLAVIVFTAIQDFGNFEVFLVAVVLAGIFQILLGFARGGIIAYYFPSSVILGMLAGIGIIIAIDQIPNALGYIPGSGDRDLVLSEISFSQLWGVLDFISPGALAITAVSLLIMLLWESSFLKQHKIFQLLPGALVAVVTGILLNLIFSGIPELMLSKAQMVNIPMAGSFSGFVDNFAFPDFSALGNVQVYITAVVIAVVASLETLLSVEAVDKIDPHKNVTPTNRELKAQGVGNMISGLIGGLPVTQVIVRSSVNVQSGGRTKKATIIHGSMILLSIIFIPFLLNLIPLATLAAILIMVGYKLAKPALFAKMYAKGKGQFVPFLFTVLGIVFTDLLIGLGIGIGVAIVFVLYNNYRIPYTLRKENIEGKRKVRIELAQEVTFLNKASLLKSLEQIPKNSSLEINASNTYYMDPDIREIIENFTISAVEKGIDLTVTDLDKKRSMVLPDHLAISFNGHGSKKTKRKKMTEKV